jgi:hypothetical protein
MQVHIKDMNGHELVIRRPYGSNYGMEVVLTLNDGSDPTHIQLMFDQETAGTLESAIGFFT